MKFEVHPSRDVWPGYQSGKAVDLYYSFIAALVFTTLEQEIFFSVAQPINIRFLSQEGVKPAEILR